jgi:hypothetical protein
MRGILLTVALLIAATLAQAQESETRILTTELCPVTSPPRDVVDKGKFAPIVAALLSAAIAPLVESVVNKAVELVNEAAKDKQIDIQAPAPVQRQFYAIGRAGDLRMNPGVSCIVIIRGRFTATPNSVSASSTDPVLKKILDAFGQGRGNKALPANGPYLQDEPDLYFETSVVLGEDRKTIAFQPRALYVGRFASSNGLFGPSDRTYKLGLTFKDSTTNEAFASTAFEFDGVKPGVGVENCTDVKIGPACDGERLGGLHGWFATRPASDATQQEANRREATALTLGNAIAAASKAEKQKSPEDLPGTRAALAKYCDEQTSVSSRLKRRI